MIPYGHQSINDDDCEKVVEVLKSDWLTTGPKVREFEEKFAKFVGAKYAVAVSNGTAALHLACISAGLNENHEIITSPMTFVASANCALYARAKPVFADINNKGLIDAERIKEKITNKTKIIIPVHYSGMSCDLKKIQEIAKKNRLIVIEDACHAIGLDYGKTKIGSCQFSDMTVFSFHPVKNITTGEGGIVTTNSEQLYNKMLTLRNHGLVKDRNNLVNNPDGPWYYEMQELGYNYRITDFQCALGLNQLSRVKKFIEKRRKIANRYNEAFKKNPHIEILNKDISESVYHLYIIKLKDASTRLALYNFLKENGINCQVHYLPVYLHPYYQQLGYKKGLCPKAEKFYERILSIPIYVDLREEEQKYIINKINEHFTRE